LSARPASWKLLAGGKVGEGGVPRPDQPHWERLGLTIEEVRGMGVRALKKRYYRYSLEWHPDRWAGYSEALQRRAQVVTPQRRWAG
jgi:hypothetical protein